MAGGQALPEASPGRYQRRRDEIDDDDCADVLGVDVRGPDADPFDIPAKRAPVERLRRWRQAALVLNASRRFRYTLDLKKEEEKEQIRRKIRAHAQVIRAALLFKEAGEKQNPETELPEILPRVFGIGEEQLTVMTRDHNYSALQEYGGVKGLANLLKTNLEKGIHGDEADLSCRANAFGPNRYPRKKGRSFWVFLWEACQDMTLVILIIAAVISLVLGIATEGVKEGWYDGTSIAFAVFLVIVVTAVSDYKQSLQFKHLNEEKQNIQVEIIRGGRRIQVSIFDIVVGDVVALKIGDQVPADGVVISGHSLAIDESSMTGESKIVLKDQKSPFLMAGCKVADGYGTMLVMAVGLNTEWGLLMASISEDNNEETPLQVRLNGVATFIGIVGLSVAAMVLVVLIARVPTRSIGLLSYTFLMETGCDDVLVPTVDYQYDTTTASFVQMLRHDQKLFSSNLAILLKWSPFASEAELLKQFDDMGDHGTKIIVFNLWFNDDGDMELDFNSDKKDILITGAHKKVQTNKPEKIATQNYISTRLRYSLRAYASVLYLHVPDNFRIILRGRVVEPHNIVNDLMYRECVLYKPQIAGLTESSIITTIGFVKGAPDIDVQGFNVYHKNRLILPFWKVANNSYGKGRGVVGILEANFIKPTHDKQDFEKSVIYQRLEIRLKEMTYEYWDLHCHRVGYDNKKLPKAARAINRANHINGGSSPISAPPRLLAADIPTSSCGIPRLSASAAREKINSLDSLSKSPMGLKRKFNSFSAMAGSADQDMDKVDVSQRKRFNEYRTLTLENDKLRNECLQYEESEKQLVLKEQRLRSEIAEAEKKYQELLVELRSLDVKKEKE